ncbi:molybdate ABC transporter substrate-binding protein [Anaerobacillus sp. MEB173]|uniref:molybdate ABC transporter substrate-binding protein n=1 Tax=Anaerobacillus sp. MEB173 TaxID=3383345 RepID=UPI003F90D283
MSACQAQGNENNIEDNTSQKITVAAASDLTRAFTELGKQFEEEHNVTISFSFGSTGQLADQIEHGAPFDVFAAANIMFVDQLREKGHVIAETQQLYALGRIGLATLKESTFSIDNIQDLANPEFKKIAIANPEHAPYGLAAKQALETSGIWDKIEDRIVYGRNITDTLALLESGNVEAAIVAKSIIENDQINFTLIEEQLHAPIEQAIAVVSTTQEEDLAKEFIRYVNGEGKAVMEKYGFIHPDDR